MELLCSHRCRLDVPGATLLKHTKQTRRTKQKQKRWREHSSRHYIYVYGRVFLSGRDVLVLGVVRKGDDSD